VKELSHSLNMFMTAEEFKRWSNDNTTLAMATEQFIVLGDPAAKVMINVVWSHRGFPPRYEGHRFNIIISRVENYDEIFRIHHPKNLNKYKYLLVNAHEPEYSILYSLELDSANRQFIMRLVLLPEMGQQLMTEEEKHAVIKHY
jgi:hypothetical protein